MVGFVDLVCVLTGYCGMLDYFVVRLRLIFGHYVDLLPCCGSLRGDIFWFTRGFLLCLGYLGL